MVTTLGVLTMVLMTAVPTTNYLPEPEPLSGGRVLNGHRFLPADTLPMPFATTSFGSSMLLLIGGSTSSLTVGNIDLSADLTYAGTGGVLRYEYSFLDHFALRAGAATLIFSGTNGRSALAIGSSVVVGVDAGATATISLGNTARLSLLFDFNFGPNVALTIGSGVRALLDSCASETGCDVSSAGILNVITSANYRPSLSAAWSPWRPLGLVAFGGFSLTTTDSDALTTGGAMTVGGTADFDFMTWSVPIGLQVLASHIAPVMGTALRTSTDVGGGVYYTGKKELAVGIQVVARRFAVRENVNVSWGTLATIGLRYYW